MDTILTDFLEETLLSLLSLFFSDRIENLMLSHNSSHREGQQLKDGREQNCYNVDLWVTLWSRIIIPSVLSISKLISMRDVYLKN